MQITNTQPGPRGVNTVSGPVLIEAGQTIDNVELSDAELAVAKKTGWFKISGRAAAAPKPEGGEEKPAMAPADLLASIDQMHFQTFKSEARKILGDETPETKDEIIAALQAKV